MNNWTPPPRPDWVQRVIGEGRHMDIRHVVPLDAEELMATARESTGFHNFGNDYWLDGFHIFIDALNNEADLHLLGRIMARSDILCWLQARLGLEAAYDQNPEIEEEVIDQPVIVTGLPRSGTSILFELLAQDTRFGSPRNWEIMFPYPPPEASSYLSDSRIERCQHLVEQWSRVVPTYASMHEMGAEIPNECIVAMSSSFMSENLPGQYQVPGYNAWYYQQDLRPAYHDYKRLLKMLQWRNPREHWLLKAPSHLGNLPVLFDTFPDARVVITHRDPVVAQASVTNLLGTLYWMRSDKPFDASAFENLMSPEAGAERLDALVDLLETNTVPTKQIYSFLYAQLVSEPLVALQALYQQLGIALTAESAHAMEHYLKQKPQGKFGKHRYGLGEESEKTIKRQLYSRYQTYFAVPDEV